jgi:hypothetical protein
LRRRRGRAFICGGSGNRRGRRRRIGLQSIAQRVRREEIGIELERRGDLHERRVTIAAIRGGSRRAEARLKSLETFSPLHSRKD